MSVPYPAIFWAALNITASHQPLTIVKMVTIFCDHQKDSLNSHHDHQYLGITTTFTNFNYFTVKQPSHLNNFIMKNLSVKPLN